MILRWCSRLLVVLFAVGAAVVVTVAVPPPLDRFAHFIAEAVFAALFEKFRDI